MAIYVRSRERRTAAIASILDIRPELQKQACGRSRTGHRRIVQRGCPAAILRIDTSSVMQQLQSVQIAAVLPVPVNLVWVVPRLQQLDKTIQIAVPDCIVQWVIVWWRNRERQQPLAASGVPSLNTRMIESTSKSPKVKIFFSLFL